MAQPSGLATDGVRLYVADSETSSILEVGLGAGARVRTIVGKGLFEFGDVDGDAAAVRSQHPLGIAARGGLLYIADTDNSRIKIIDRVGQNVPTRITTRSGPWTQRRTPFQRFDCET
jgi:DNA-binding beta-propeller fold protein YncE